MFALANLKNPEGATTKNFMTNATALAANPVFRLKLILIVLAGFNALLYWLWISKSVAAANVNGQRRLQRSFRLRFPCSRGRLSFPAVA